MIAQNLCCAHARSSISSILRASWGFMFRSRARFSAALSADSLPIIAFAMLYAARAVSICSILLRTSARFAAACGSEPLGGGVVEACVEVSAFGAAVESADVESFELDVDCEVDVGVDVVEPGGADDL